MYANYLPQYLTYISELKQATITVFDKLYTCPQFLSLKTWYVVSDRSSYCHFDYLFLRCGIHESLKRCEPEKVWGGHYGNCIFSHTSCPVHFYSLPVYFLSIFLYCLWPLYIMTIRNYINSNGSKMFHWILLVMPPISHNSTRWSWEIWLRAGQWAVEMTTLDLWLFSDCGQSCSETLNLCD